LVCAGRETEYSMAKGTYVLETPEFRAIITG